MKWEYQCAKCKKWFADKDIQADHKQPAGTLRTFADLPGFAERLFCEVDGYEMLCKKKCHLQKTLKERQLSKMEGGNS